MPGKSLFGADACKPKPRTSRERKRESNRRRRSTPEGKERDRESDRRYRSTPKGKEQARESVRRFRSTPKGRRQGLLNLARRRAKKAGVPCTITEADIVIPDVCPVLGIPLKRGQGKPCPNSPSLDRINPALGYVPGNVQVISHRANAIKSDATPDELRLVAERGFGPAEEQA